MGTCGRRFRRLSSMKLSVFHAKSRRMSRIVLNGINRFQRAQRIQIDDGNEKIKKG